MRVSFRTPAPMFLCPFFFGNCTARPVTRILEAFLFYLYPFLGLSGKMRGTIWLGSLFFFRGGGIGGLGCVGWSVSGGDGCGLSEAFWRGLCGLVRW